LGTKLEINCDRGRYGKEKEDRQNNVNMAINLEEKQIELGYCTEKAKSAEQTL